MSAHLDHRGGGFNFRCKVALDTETIHVDVGSFKFTSLGQVSLSGQ